MCLEIVTTVDIPVAITARHKNGLHLSQKRDALDPRPLSPATAQNKSDDIDQELARIS